MQNTEGNTILAELLPNNLVKVQRIKYGKEMEDSTVLNGSNFEVGCGNCGQLCLERREGTNFIQPACLLLYNEDQNSHERVMRIPGESLLYTFGTIGLYVS
jgi:hypothetical protein